MHEGPIFKQPNGDPLAAEYISKKVFPKACKKAGVRKIRIHDLRHTFASQFMMNNGNIYDLQKILGHSSVKTTERYSHFSMQHIRNRAEVVSFGEDQKVIAVDFKRTGTEANYPLQREGGGGVGGGARSNTFHQTPPNSLISLVGDTGVEPVARWLRAHQGFPIKKITLVNSSLYLS